MLILGESGAGKTTMARKILNENAEMPQEKDTTRGIDVYKWDFSHTLPALADAQKNNCKYLGFWWSGYL